MYHSSLQDFLVYDNDCGALYSTKIVETAMFLIFNQSIRTNFLPFAAKCHIVQVKYLKSQIAEHEQLLKL